MLQTLKTMAERYNRYMTMVGRSRAREVLLRSNDHLLEDAGFSRALLEEGVSAWPWQANSDERTLQPLQFDTKTVRAAIDELQTYSQADLHDLGITHGNMKEAVLHGREGIERDVARKAA